MKLFVGYSKAPEQPQSSARPICQSHTMTNTGREPVTIHIAAYRSSPRYALHHGRRHCHDLEVIRSKPGRVELWVHSTSVLSCTLTKNINMILDLSKQNVVVASVENVIPQSHFIGFYMNIVFKRSSFCQKCRHVIYLKQIVNSAHPNP